MDQDDNLAGRLATLCYMGTQLPFPKMGQSPLQFSAHVYCGQMAGWIKMPLGTEIGLIASDILLDGDPAPPPPEGGGGAPNFRSMSIVAKQLDGSRWHLVRRKASAQ